MAQRKLIDRPVRVNINISDSIRSQVELELFSELEGRVPYGAWTRLLNEVLAKWLAERGVEL